MSDRRKELTAAELERLRELLDHAIKTVPAGPLRDALTRQRDELDDAPAPSPGPTLAPGVTAVPRAAPNVRAPIRPAGPGGGAPIRPGSPAPGPATPLHGHMPRLPDGPTVVGDVARLPGDRPQLELPPCVMVQARAERSLVSSGPRWWANWGKTHAYVCQRMFFPRSVDEVAAAVRRAEADGVPLRAVGGGWSFSEAYVPGDVAMARPVTVDHLDALATAIPSVVTYPADPYEPVVASLPARPTSPPPDASGSLTMRHPNDDTAREWSYLGGGMWSLANDLDLRFNAGDQWGIPDRLGGDGAEKATIAFAHGYRPIFGDDGPGSLALFDTAPGRGWVTSAYYKGKGRWIIGLPGASAVTRTIRELVREDLEAPFHTTLRVRPSTPEWSLSLLLEGQGQPWPQAAYLVDTSHLASSLQQQLPDLLSADARRRTAAEGSARKHYFHVEAGITMAALGELLDRQSPRLAIQATGGSPGASLAGALATGTHGGEHVWPLLVDSVKAVHLVGPGGQQWWIEGSDSIADPDQLLARYPCLDRSRIIAGDGRFDGLSAQDWLDAVVVAVGSLGIVYSLVIEVVPAFGLHEAVVQSTWSQLLARARVDRTPLTIAAVRGPRTVVAAVPGEPAPAFTPIDPQRVGDAVFALLEDGAVNGTGIAAASNRYIDLVLDPNPIRSGGSLDWTCWVINRETTPSVPFDVKPAPRDALTRVGEPLLEALRAHSGRLQQLFGIEIGQVLHGLPALRQRADRLFASADLLDTALDTLFEPITTAREVEIARALVTAVFSGLLGVENGRAETTAASSNVGEIGFPASGIMGTAIEIALPTREAFSFLQAEVLDRIARSGMPFFGYVSVRMCPRTRALLGMQQHAPSVMIEVVAFGTPSARAFVTALERRTVEMIRGGLDAMLHWGLENTTLDAEALRSIPSLNAGSREEPSRLFKFLGVRRAIRAVRGAAPNVFDSAFTRRLGL